MVELAVSLTIVLFLALAWTVMYERRQRRYERNSARAALQQGLSPVLDLSSLTPRVHPLLRPLGLDKPERAFSFSVGGSDAFLYEWRSSYDGWAPDEYWHGYVILGRGVPHVRALPKAFFGKPADPIDFPEDLRFSKAFWIEGPDQPAARRYLGPELRRFLLAQGGGWGFLAGPEGVALVQHIGTTPTRNRMPVAEGSQTAALFERLATVTEG